MKENDGRMNRTPDKIKKGLLCVSSEHQGCIDCAYRHDRECSDYVAADALAYIQQLEAELEKVKQDRDAAVRDCARFPCYTCKERENGDFCPQCRTTGAFRSLHEWRGPCAENGGIEK